MIGALLGLATAFLFALTACTGLTVVAVTETIRRRRWQAIAGYEHDRAMRFVQTITHLTEQLEQPRCERTATTAPTPEETATPQPSRPPGPTAGRPA